MKMEHLISKVSEIFVENAGHTVTVTTWSNGEGVNILVQGKDLTTILAGSLRWEDADSLIAALSLARTA